MIAFIKSHTTLPLLPAEMIHEIIKWTDDRTLVDFTQTNTYYHRSIKLIHIDRLRVLQIDKWAKESQVPLPRTILVNQKMRILIDRYESCAVRVIELDWKVWVLFTSKMLSTKAVQCALFNKNKVRLSDLFITNLFVLPTNRSPTPCILNHSWSHVDIMDLHFDPSTYSGFQLHMISSRQVSLDPSIYPR